MDCEQNPLSELHPNSAIAAYFMVLFERCTGFPGGSDGEYSACSAGDLGSIPGLRGSSGEGNDYPLHYSGLENSMDRGAWQATVHGVKKSWTRLNDFRFH